MTEERVPAQATREEAKHYILLTLDRFRVMTLHLADNKSRLPSALNGNEGGLDLLYELEARDFYSNLMFLYTSDIFEVLSNEGLRELLLKCRELSDRFCLKVRIPVDIRVVGEDVIERFTSELTEESLGRLRENLGEVEQTRALLLAQAGDVDRGRADKSELETILSKRQEYEAAKKRHDEANHQIQLALPYCLDERACQPYYDIRRENKSIMDKIVREHPLVYHIKDRRDAKSLRREINSAFDDIGAAISRIISRIIEGKYPIWRFDALIEELLEKYTPEEAEQIKEHLARMKRSEDIKDLVLTIGSVTLSVLTLLIPGGAVAGLLCARSGLQIAGVAVSVASAMNDLDDSLLYRQEVLAHTRVSPEIQELMEEENISLTDAQTQLLTALISIAFVGADLNDARKSLELIRKLDQLNDGVVTALKQSKRFGEKAFQKLSVESLNALDDNFLLFFSNDIENIVRMYEKLPTEVVCTIPGDLLNRYTKSFGKFDDFAEDIGKYYKGTIEDKVRLIQQAFENLPAGDRRLLTIPDDAVYVKGFGPSGRVEYLWPDNMGLKVGSDTSIVTADGEVALPDELYRVGNYWGNNFSDAAYSYDELGIPYRDNDEALTIFKIKKDSYVKKIDALASGNLDELNEILRTEGIAEINKSDFKRLRSSYIERQASIKKEKKITCNTKYGVAGTVAEWYNPNDTSVKWFNGGAPQFITPLNVFDMETLGIVTEVE